MMALLKSKTFWTCVIGVVAAASGYFTGTLTATQAGGAVLTALAFIFQRSATAGVQTTVDQIKSAQ